MHNCEFTEIIVQRYSMRPSHKREPNFHRFLVLFPTHPAHTTSWPAEPFLFSQVYYSSVIIPRSIRVAYAGAV
jgi:hypothetical protein